MDWARILAYVTGTVDQELLARNEYLAAENGIIKAQLKGRLKLSDAVAQNASTQGSAVPRTATQRALDPRTFPSAITCRDNCPRGQSEAVKWPVAVVCRIFRLRRLERSMPASSARPSRRS